jgi:hypothetical protein
LCFLQFERFRLPNPEFSVTLSLPFRPSGPASGVASGPGGRLSGVWRSWLAHLVWDLNLFNFILKIDSSFL